MNIITISEVEVDIRPVFLMDAQGNQNVCFKHNTSKMIHYCHHYIWHYNNIIPSRLLLEQMTVGKQLEIGVGIDQMDDKECLQQAPEFITILWGSCCSIFTFSVVICISLFVLLLFTIAFCLFLLLFTTSDYPLSLSIFLRTWYVIGTIPPTNVYSIPIILYSMANLTISAFISSFTFTSNKVQICNYMQTVHVYTLFQNISMHIAGYTSYI
jgi:hypothetical protein